MCVAVTSDVVCYLFIPVQWLFFAASTYVWVQYVWHTERGVCLPTVSLWLLFVYIEASVRLREFKSLPFHLDLCRPFAAHCIGYPVVTLGFGFKSYISYRMRVRKQKDVQKENDFYTHLLQQALPSEQHNTEKQKATTAASSVTTITSNKSQEEVISNGITPTNKKSGRVSTSESLETKDCKNKNNHIEDYEFIEQSLPKRSNNVNDFEEENFVNDQQTKTFKQANGVAKSTTKLNSQKDVSNKKGKNTNTKEPNGTQFTINKEDLVPRLEADIKRLKADLQSSRNCEQELRSQINSLVVADKSTKSELFQLRQDNESLQTKLHNLVTSRQQDKQNLQLLERKLQEERRCKAVIEQQLATERKAKKEQEAANRAAVIAAAASRECSSEYCKNRRREMENDSKTIRRELKMREEQLRKLERETQNLRLYDSQNETEVLMSALAAMQDKNTHLENSLSAETRLKLDLFSALGDAKRQIEIQQGLLVQKESELEELKQKIAEAMALVPASTYNHTSTGGESPHFSSKFASPPASPPREEDVLAMSSLNPNASDYTPKTPTSSP